MYIHTLYTYMHHTRITCMDTYMCMHAYIHTHADDTALLYCAALSQIALERNLLLALEWINFEHHPSDLRLFFTGQFYGKLAELSGVPNTELPVQTALPSTRTWSVLKKVCLLMMQLLVLQVG